MAHSSFVWTDTEAELLLNTALQYKANKAQEGVDWESCYLKYVDILALFLEQYPAETSKDFPHRKEDVTRTILTTKLKAVRGKYRIAADTGRKRGYGRVVLLYFELCEKLWGGSSAVLEASPSHSTSPPVPLTVEVIGTGTGSSEADESVSPAVEERKDLLHAKLKQQRQEKLKRRLSPKVQWQNALEEDQRMKRKLVEILEASEKQASDNFQRVANTLERLTETISAGFALLQQVVNMPPPPPPPPPPHYNTTYEEKSPHEYKLEADHIKEEPDT